MCARNEGREHTYDTRYEGRCPILPLPRSSVTLTRNQRKINHRLVLPHPLTPLQTHPALLHRNKMNIHINPPILNFQLQILLPPLPLPPTVWMRTIPPLMLTSRSLSTAKRLTPLQRQRVFITTIQNTFL